jgi:hypothetical protein
VSEDIIVSNCVINVQLQLSAYASSSPAVGFGGIVAYRNMANSLFLNNSVVTVNVFDNISAVKISYLGIVCG